MLELLFLCRTDEIEKVYQALKDLYEFENHSFRQSMLNFKNTSVVGFNIPSYATTVSTRHLNILPLSKQGFDFVNAKFPHDEDFQNLCLIMEKTNDRESFYELCFQLTSNKKLRNWIS
ncbi:hypothetical protein N9D09_01240 [bacterium]|nr:hypothetical protein [bacterium]